MMATQHIDTLGPIWKFSLRGVLTFVASGLDITVFLSRFGAFLRSEMKFSKRLVQSPHHLVTCAHDNRTLSFF